MKTRKGKGQRNSFSGGNGLVSALPRNASRRARDSGEEGGGYKLENKGVREPRPIVKEKCHKQTYILQRTPTFRKRVKGPSSLIVVRGGLHWEDSVERELKTGENLGTKTAYASLHFEVRIF